MQWSKVTGVGRVASKLDADLTTKVLNIAYVLRLAAGRTVAFGLSALLQAELCMLLLCYLQLLPSALQWLEKQRQALMKASTGSAPVRVSAPALRAYSTET